MQQETPRLILRLFQDSDLEPFVNYRSDPEVARYQGWDAPFPRETAASFIEEMKDKPLGLAGEWYQVAIALRSTGQLIGDCAYHILAEDARQAEIGFTLARTFQGSGYATEAVTALLDILFGELSLHRVTATCDADNGASARLLDRIGMRREGHSVENIWFKGRWGSEFLYAMLQHDWQERFAADSDSTS
jgi:RimJ/RimL family protein N-acetyltransferase